MFVCILFIVFFFQMEFMDTTVPIFSLGVEQVAGLRALSRTMLPERQGEVNLNLFGII